MTRTHSVPLPVSTHCMIHKQHHLVNHSPVNHNLSSKVSMASPGVLCLGCNKSFDRVSLHWSRVPVCFSAHQEAAALSCNGQQLLGRDARRHHDWSSSDNSSSTRSSSSGSESSCKPTNLDVSGIIGAVIHGGRNDSAQRNSLSSSSMEAIGTLHCETVMADGSVANTRVSARNLKKRAFSAKRQRTDQPMDVDEDEDDDDSSLSSRHSEMFLCPPDDGNEMEEEDQELHTELMI